MGRGADAMSSRLIDSLQVFRGLAALAVVAHHAAVSTDAFVQPIPAALMAAFDLGALGVDFFFVLSGFIIMHAHRHEAGRTDRVVITWWWSGRCCGRRGGGLGTLPQRVVDDQAVDSVVFSRVTPPRAPSPPAPLPRSRARGAKAAGDLCAAMRAPNFAYVPREYC